MEPSLPHPQWERHTSTVQFSPQQWFSAELREQSLPPGCWAYWDYQVGSMSSSRVGGHNTVTQYLSHVLDPHLVAGFSISDDPLTRHRALNIGNVSSDLSGLYSCRVSSNRGDSFQSKQLTVFCKSV